MTNELCINGFSGASEDEMMAIDGGRNVALVALGVGGLIVEAATCIACIGQGI